MREIEFRGKRKDNGEWVYGGYHKHIKRQISPIGDSLQDDDIAHLIIQSGFADWNMPKPLQAIEVIPETVGQFTGLHDKNGKEIYEGDVISLDCYSYEEPEDEYCGEVVYSNHLSSFCLRNCEQLDGWIPICELGGSYTTITTLCGNIHDNPELLKEVTDEA